MTQENTTQATTEITTPLTRREQLEKRYNEAISRITALTKQANDYVAEITTIDALANVGLGTIVVIGLGVGPTARDVQGTVTGVRTEEDGTKSYKVLYGTGFDTDVATVKGSRIKSVVTPAVAEAEPVQAAPAETVAGAVAM